MKTEMQKAIYQAQVSYTQLNTQLALLLPPEQTEFPEPVLRHLASLENALETARILMEQIDN